MPRRPAKVTQADIARAVRAAKEAGAAAFPETYRKRLKSTLSIDVESPHQ